MTSCGAWQKLENIDENGPIGFKPLSCVLPETPTESMEFLGRSWSLSAMELSKALSNSHGDSNSVEKIVSSKYPCSIEPHDLSSIGSQEYLASRGSPTISPRDSEEMKELLVLHQALNPDFLLSQKLLKNGLYKSILRGRAKGRWMKDQKERKKQEIRIHNAQLHAAVSVVAVSAAIAAHAASDAMSAEVTSTHQKTTTISPGAIASAAALVASHCIEIAENMGADHEHVLAVVTSAVNARTNGDIMALTAGAATALRGAATLRARLQLGYGNIPYTLAEEKGEEGNQHNISAALNFVSIGGDLLKQTRKGALHWKQVSFNINSNWQVVAKMKSKHMGGTFTKKKKCAVYEVCCDISAWPGREREDNSENRAYFGIRTADRVIEFECQNKSDKQIWIQGIQQMLICRATMT